jgi:hypothetical protein
MQPFEFVIFVVKGYREFVSYSEFPWQITSGLPVIRPESLPRGSGIEGVLSQGIHYVCPVI